MYNGSDLEDEDEEINPAPVRYATAVFVLREIVSLLFVFAWLVITAIDMFSFPEDELVPFWFHMLGAGVLAYSLGVNVANLTAFRGVQITATSASRE